MSSHDWEKLASLARSVSAKDDDEETLQRAVDGVVDLIGNCEHAGIAVLEKDGSVSTRAATDDLVRALDEAQFDAAEGPLFDALQTEEVVKIDEGVAAERWPKWAQRVIGDHGVRSMLCLQLFVGDSRPLGCLTLYSTRPEAFDRDDCHSAFVLAAHIAIVMTDAQQKRQLESAIASRTMIGQAQGRLMERFSLDAEQAFAVLKRISQNRNVKLNLICEDIALNGIQPELLD